MCKIANTSDLFYDMIVVVESCTPKYFLKGKSSITYHWEKGNERQVKYL